MPAIKWMLPLAALLASGCASTPAVRGLAEDTGVFVTSLRQGTAEFVADQNRLNAQNEARLRNLAAHAAASRAQVAQQRIASTRAGDTDLLATRSLAGSVGAGDVVGSLRTQTIQAPSVTFAGAEGYEMSAKALVDVGTKPDAIAVLMGLIAFGFEVRDSHAKLAEEAGGSAAGAAAQGAAAIENAKKATPGIEPAQVEGEES